MGLKLTVFTVEERSSRAKDEGLSSASYVFGLKSWPMASDYFRLLTLVSLAPVPVLGTVQPPLMSNHPTILLFLPPLLQVQLQCHLLEVFSNQPATGDLFQSISTALYRTAPRHFLGLSASVNPPGKKDQALREGAALTDA